MIHYHPFVFLLNEELRGQSSSIPPNTRNDADEAKLGNRFGFTVRVKARSGAPASSGWRCLAGKCCVQNHRSLTGDRPAPPGRRGRLPASPPKNRT